MADARSARRVLFLVGIAAAAAVPAFAMGSGPQQTDASWVVTKAAAVTATAVNPAPPTALTCPASGLLAADVTFTWTAPAGTAPSGYTLKWSGASSGSSAWPTTTGTVASPIGTILVSVYADYGPWQSAAGSQTRHISGIAFVGWTCGA